MDIDRGFFFMPSFVFHFTCNHSRHLLVLSPRALELISELPLLFLFLLLQLLATLQLESKAVYHTADSSCVSKLAKQQILLSVHLPGGMLQGQSLLIQ